MTRPIIVACAMTLLLALLPGAANAREVTVEQLTRAGWLCMDEGPEGPTPCFARGEEILAGTATGSIVLTFGPDGDFLGTEKLIHQDRYSGQPCPQDQVAGGDGSYIDLEPLFGIPYYVCHHFDSPFT